MVQEPHSLEDVLVESRCGREHREAVGQQQPPSLRIGSVVIAPRLVAQLAQDLITQPLVGQTLKCQQNLSPLVS